MNAPHAANTLKYVFIIDYSLPWGVLGFGLG